MLSFIVPAHNEQACLAGTLKAIHEAAKSTDQPYEIVVVDDASTDATVEIAQQNVARVISVNHRQISATRNSGGRASLGERLFFVDADTIINPRVVASAMRAMDKGAAGGGAPAHFQWPVPLYAPLLLFWINLFMRVAGISAGAFMFCTRDAFLAVGGFDERLFGAEDAAMSWALKRAGRFVVLWPHVLTSGRRTRGKGGVRMVIALLRMAVLPGTIKQRARVDKVWYDSDREANEHAANSLALRLSNAVLFISMVVLLTGWIWAFIPESVTPEGSALGIARMAMGLFIYHFGLLLWPCIYFLVRILIRQTRWVERIKVIVLIAACLWGAWGNTKCVIEFWTWTIGNWIR